MMLVPSVATRRQSGGAPLASTSPAVGGRSWGRLREHRGKQGQYRNLALDPAIAVRGQLPRKTDTLLWGQTQLVAVLQTQV